jgi:hypothetical protein
VDIGLEAAFVADCNVRHAAPHREDLDAELMSENPRIAEERLPAVKGMVIRSAEADAMDSDQGFSCSGSAGLGRLIKG